MKIFSAAVTAITLFASPVFAQETPAQVREEARRAGVNCVYMQECLRGLTEQVSPEGTPFEQMTQHSHYLAAVTALDNEDFQSTINHFRAIDRNSRYGQVHHEELDLFVERFQQDANRHNAQITQARGPAPIPNERGGNFRQVRVYMQTHLADPRSYQPAGCTTPEPDREGYHNTCTFRARNQFGALAIDTWDFLWVGGRVVYGGEGVPVGDTIAEAIQ